jgi:hypothetical protein
MIDNYEQAIALMEKMRACLPIPTKVTPESGQILKEQGNHFSRDHIFTIEEVYYSGDEGGILCVIQSGDDQQIKHFFSLTHLRLQEDHPFAEEIKSYQCKRVARLAMQDGKMGKARRLANKSKKKKGFGNL